MIRALKRALLGLALLAAAYAGFRWGPAVFPRVERALGIERAEEAAPAEATPSPELADATLERFDAFRRGAGDDRLSLGGTELSAVVRYALPGMLPPGVAEPTVELESGQVHVEARVAVEAFPDLPKLDAILGLLPDTVAIELRGSLVPHDQRNLALLVDRVQAARVPLPTRMVADVLAGLGREGTPSLPADALAVPLPDGLQSVFVQRDSLVLVRRSEGSG